VADEQELRALAHLADQIAVALGVGIVQRRVHLVEQAERRRVELEDREHERDRRQCLLATAEQMDGAVLLARRLRHHLHASVQDLVARHHQLRVAAAEQAREHAAEVFVDLVEGAAQQVACFEVDLVDRVFQRRDRFAQVGHLRVEKHLALAGRAELVQRCQIHRTERGDLFLDAVDLGLQAPELDAALGDAPGQRFAVDVGGGELVEILRAAELRGLQFELQFGDLLAQRLQAVLEAQTLFVGAPKLRAQVVVFAARVGQMLFTLQLERQRGLQARLRGGVVEAAELELELLTGLHIAGDLRRRGFDAALQFVAPRRQRARLEVRLLGLAFQRALLLARIGQHTLGGDHRIVEFGVALLRVRQFDVEFLEARLAAAAAFFQRFELGVELGQFVGELFAPLGRGIGLLRQAQQFDMQRVRLVLRRTCLAARRQQALRGVGIGRFEAHRCGLAVVGDQGLRTLLTAEVLDLLRTRQHAGLFGIGRVEAHRVLAHRMAVARHDHFAVRELAARGHCVVDAGRRVHAFEPVAQQRLQAGVAQAQQIAQPRQRLVAVRDGAVRQRVERQPGRWRVSGEGAHAVQPPHRQRVQPFAQRRFERAFPAGLDVDLRPQARQPRQAVALEPGLELAFGLHLVLQRTQSVEAGADVGLGGRFAVHRVLRGAALGVERRHLFGQLVQPRIGFVARFVGSRFLRLQGLESRHVGRLQTLALAGQAFTPALQLPRLLFDVAAVGRQHLDLLLHLRHRAALLVAGVLRRAHGVVQRRQLQRLLLGLRHQRFGLLFGADDLLGDVFQLDAGGVAPLGPARVLRLQLGQPRLGTLAAFDDVADALFEPADLQRRFGQRALLFMQRITCGVMRLAHRFELGFDMAQLGQARFERIRRLRGGGLHALFFAGGVARLQEPQLVQLQRAVVLQPAVARGHLGLLFQLLEVAVEFTQDVVDARQVLARVLQAVLGFAPPLLVLRDARGFFQEHAQFLGARLDDAADRALADDGVGARAEAGAEEHVLHVAPAHRLVVDVVAAAAVAREHTLDGDLAERVPLAAGTRQRVVEHQLDAGAAGRLALARAVEDDVLHRLAAQLAGLAFAEHPAHRVHDVALAATVRPDDTDELPRELERGGFGKRLEAAELDLVEPHEGRCK